MVSRYIVYKCDICGKEETINCEDRSRADDRPRADGWQICDWRLMYPRLMPDYVICPECAAKIAKVDCDFRDNLISKAVTEYLQRMKEAAQPSNTTK